MQTLLLLLLATQGVSLPPEPPVLGASKPSTWIETRFHRIHLRNGNFIDGQLTDQNARLVVLEMREGHFTVRRDMIERVEFVKMRSLRPTPQLPDTRKSEAGKGQPDASAKARAVSGTPPGSAQARREVDRLLAMSRQMSGEVRLDLAPGIEATGPDGIAYACWLVARRPEGVPIEPLLSALGWLKHPQVLPALASVVESGTPDQHMAAVGALETIGTPDAMALLFPLLESPATPVWKACSEAIEKLGRKHPVSAISEALVARLESARLKAPLILTIAKLGDAQGHRAIKDLLRSGEEQDKRDALQGLAIYKNPEDCESVRPLLTERSPSLRKEACMFLGRAKDRAAVPELIELLPDPDPALVQSALWALRQISGEKYAGSADLWRQWWEVKGKVESERR